MPRLIRELCSASLAVVATGSMLWIVGCLLIDTIPPHSLTVTRMWVMKRRVLRYAHTHGELPSSTSELPALENYDNEVTDAWGGLIRMTIWGDQVTLTSFGRDGKPGGKGDDADMIGIFNAKTETGAWADELGYWTVDPFASKPGPLRR